MNSKKLFRHHKNILKFQCELSLEKVFAFNIIAFYLYFVSWEKGLHSFLQLPTMHTNWFELKLPNIDLLKLLWTFFVRKPAFTSFLSLLCDFAFYFNYTICNFVLFMHSRSTTKNAATTKVWAHKILNTITFVQMHAKYYLRI